MGSENDNQNSSINRRSFIRKTAGVSVGVMGVGALPMQPVQPSEPLPIELYSPLVFDDMYVTDGYIDMLIAEELKTIEKSMEEDI